MNYFKCIACSERSLVPPDRHDAWLAGHVSTETLQRTIPHPSETLLRTNPHPHPTETPQGIKPHPNPPETPQRTNPHPNLTLTLLKHRKELTLTSPFSQDTYLQYISISNLVAEWTTDGTSRC